VPRHNLGNAPRDKCRPFEQCLEGTGNNLRNAQIVLEISLTMLKD
jgi:hypothetical protein